jgi:hypothetical protein
MQSSQSDDPEAAAAALMRRFPGWDIHRVFAGWIAVPAGTPFIYAMHADSLAEKLQAAEDFRP